ncbi:SurA N-terminal domain-containing protein [Porticoccaceae bacterium]|nr:SurA N-terminal domain-containing protein [Porticoccaceae bacterium]
MKCSDQLSLKLLALAAATGIALGGLEANGWWWDSRSLPRDSAARVNHTEIRQLDYQRALGLMASGKRSPLNAEDRILVLERLIQEELLVQYGIAQDLLRADRKVRSAVLQSVLAGLDVQARAAVKQDSDNGLQDYLIELRNSADIQIGGQP